jgi:hypothetical protein
MDSDVRPKDGRTDANPGHPTRSGSFWQARGYDRNVYSAKEFAEKLRYIHENPVKRGLVKAAEDWKWSSFRHYAFREVGVVEIESEWTARDRETCIAGGGPRIFLRLPVVGPKS